MELTAQENKVFVELYSKKKKADRQWDRVFLDALHGNMNREEMSLAMNDCNTADWGIIEFERSKKVLKKGKEGLSEQEYYKKYIEPYSQSRAP